jgi:glycosyltransferase involved in cell wall biosynthesis
MIPKVYQNFKKPGAMNVAFTMFETSKIPDIWVQQCNQMDAVLVPCQWNKEVFINSGVKVPVEVAIPGIDPSQYPTKKHIPGQKPNFKFYSIFQWSERKNPAALIRAFVSAFAGNSSVSLTLKTYLKAYSKDEEESLRREILAIRDSVEVKSYPQIILKHEKLTDQQMVDIHMQHDCFVLPTRAEGLGLPYIDSMMIGNPTVGTNYSGNLEFMTNDNSYLIDCQTEPVFNMRHLGGWYTGDMMWAQPSVGNLAQIMKEIYNNQELAKKRAARARDDLMSNMGWDNRLLSLRSTLESMYNSWKR